MKRLLVVGCLGLGACETLERLPDLLFDARTPRERYEAGLAQAGLTGTALVRDWLAAGEQALVDAPPVSATHVEEGYLVPGEPLALAFRVVARRGQAIAFAFGLAGDSAALVFLDAWRVESDTARPYRRVAVADSGSRELVFEPRQGGEYVFRAQPELLRGGRFRVAVDIRPTLAFPVGGRGERDVGSRFGDPRDGGVRDHHGIDIFAPRGTPAVAAAEAVVTRVRTTPRGGHVVWLRDDRGNALYYAHLDRQHVTEGARVLPGDTVGFVGNTGNAVTSPPHLHFGIYRRGEGPMDPWWFVHRPRAAVPRLTADTTLLGAWGRTRIADARVSTGPAPGAPAVLTLARHTPLRVVAAVGEWYRVRLPNGLAGYIGARFIESTERAVEAAEHDLSRRVLARPVEPVSPGGVVAMVDAGAVVDVLGRFGQYILVRTAAGEEGWMADGMD